MAEGFGDYFIRDVDEQALDEGETIATPVVLPQPPVQQVAPATPQPMPVPPAAPVAPSAPVTVQPVQAAPAAVPPASPQAPPVAVPAVAQPPRDRRMADREAMLVETLNAFMASSPEVQAAALVSMDGFTIASALPAGMQEDRVGAMSAAILGLGERAAAELGRGALSQVFIEGDDGYVLLVSAGERAVMTALADRDAKLGLVLYDMKAAAGRIGDILR